MGHDLVCYLMAILLGRLSPVRSKLDGDTASMAIVAAETDYGEVVGEGDGSGDTL